MSYNESTLEQATLDWLNDLGYEIGFGPNLAFDGVSPEREAKNYSDIVLRGRLEAAIKAINPEIPAEARNDALEKIIAAPWLKPGLTEVNSIIHEMIINGVGVSYRAKDGLIRHGQVKLIDFENVENNNFFAVTFYTTARFKIIKSTVKRCSSYIQ